MLNPVAIFELTEENSVRDPHGQMEDVSRVAVWDWYEGPPGGEKAAYELHSSSGKVFVDIDDVNEIVELS